MAAHPDNEMPFTRVNYRLLVIGLAIVLLGFILMAGGGSGDPNAFDGEAIFSARRAICSSRQCDSRRAGPS